MGIQAVCRSMFYKPTAVVSVVVRSYLCEVSLHQCVIRLQHVELCHSVIVVKNVTWCNIKSQAAVDSVF